MDMPNARATFKRVDGQLRVETFNGRPVTDPDLVGRFEIGPQGEFQENGEPDVLYHNLGGTNFVAIPFTGGLIERPKINHRLDARPTRRYL